ncbi:MAG: hypothetical protein E7015_01090 [Alphaproteobacteria bacterium]|nr:hypothetical protein [Alphaproteobacteria bacterium]
MKKSCICFSLIVALNGICTDIKQNIPQYSSIQSIVEDESVQDSVRHLLNLALSVFKESLPNKNVSGSLKDIQELSKNIKYLQTLKINLDQADNLRRLLLLIGIHQNAKQELSDVVEWASQIRKATDILSLLKVLSTPVPVSLVANGENKGKTISLLNEKIVSEIHRLQDRDKLVESASSLSEIREVWKDYPAIQEKFDAIQENEKQLQQFKNIASIQDLENSNLVNSSLIQDVQKIQAELNKIKNASSWEDVILSQLLNPSLIENLQNLRSDNDKLEAEKRELIDRLNKSEKQIEVQADAYKRNIRFLTLLLAVINRMLTGFDYRSKNIDFAKEKESNKSVTFAAQKTGLSYLGGNPETLYGIANDLNKMEQILIVEYEWINKVDELLKFAESIQERLKAFNADAEFLKVNASFLIDVLTSAKNFEVTKPPRDNVANFSLTVATQQR